MIHSVNEKGFEEIVYEYTDYVYNLAYRLLGNREDAKDAVQETFLKLHKNLKQYDKNREFKNWICTIALNTSRDIYRARKRRGENFCMDEIDFSDHKNEGDKIQQQIDVQQFLSLLPLEYRSIMILFYMEEKTIKEIAGLLKIPLVLVKVRLYRARKMIVKNMQENKDE